MAYSALEKMRRINESKYGCDVGPLQPACYEGGKEGFDLKSCALRFLHDRCEDMRFGHLTVIENLMMAPMDILGKSKREAYDKGMELGLGKQDFRATYKIVNDVKD